MGQDKFVAHVFLKVKATNELLIPGMPYVLSLYHDCMTGLNYVKLYRYQNTHDGVKCVAYIDATRPLRSYQYDELVLVMLTKDSMGYETFEEVEMTNDSEIPNHYMVTNWSYQLVNSVAVPR